MYWIYTQYKYRYKIINTRFTKVIYIWGDRILSLQYNIKVWVLGQVFGVLVHELKLSINESVRTLCRCVKELIGIHCIIFLHLDWKKKLIFSKYILKHIFWTLQPKSYCFSFGIFSIKYWIIKISKHSCVNRAIFLTILFGIYIPLSLITYFKPNQDQNLLNMQ